MLCKGFKNESVCFIFGEDCEVLLLVVREWEMLHVPYHTQEKFSRYLELFISNYIQFFLLFKLVLHGTCDSLGCILVGRVLLFFFSWERLPSILFCFSFIIQLELKVVVFI